MKYKTNQINNIKVLAGVVEWLCVAKFEDVKYLSQRRYFQSNKAQLISSELFIKR